MPGGEGADGLSEGEVPREVEPTPGDGRHRDRHVACAPGGGGRGGPGGAASKKRPPPKTAPPSGEKSTSPTTRRGLACGGGLPHARHSARRMIPTAERFTAAARAGARSARSTPARR